MPNIIVLMAAGIVLLDIAIVIKVLALFHRPSRKMIIRKGSHYGLLAIFILSTLSLLATLWMQYFDNLAPCIFCWYQRICMYPIVLISFIAFVKNKNLSDIADYVLALSVIGALIALYQHVLQLLPSGALIPCDASDTCAIRSIFEFGFVTLPWMAFTVFVAIALIALLGRRQQR